MMIRRRRYAQHMYGPHAVFRQVGGLQLQAVSLHENAPVPHPAQVASSQVLTQVAGQVASQVGQPGQVHCV